MLLLILLHAIFASTYTLGKMALSYCEPVFLIAVRMLLSAGILFCVLGVLRKPFTIKKSDWLLFGALAFFQIYFAYVPEFIYLKYVSTTKWAIIFTLTPFFTAVIGYFMGKEQMTALKIIGLIIGLVGVLPVLIDKDVAQDMSVLWTISVPEIVFLVCTVSYSFGWILAKILVKERHYSALLVNGVAMLLGGTGALITSPFTDNWSSFPIRTPGMFAVILSLLIMASLAAFVLNTYLLRYYSATFLLFLMFVDPLYTALYGKFFLNEPLVKNFFLSVFLLFIGLYLFYREELKEVNYASRGLL